jgi:hypothetical protein
VSAFIDTNKNKWLEKRPRTHFLNIIFMERKKVSTYKGADVYLAGTNLTKIYSQVLVRVSYLAS